MMEISHKNWNGTYLGHSFKLIKRKHDKTLYSNLLIANISDRLLERDKNRYVEVSRLRFLNSLRSDVI